MVHALAGVFLGAGLGGVARYLATLTLPESSVLLVNTLGSLLIGIAASTIDRTSASHLFLVVGFLGGFTTFSAFSLELLQLILDGRYLTALTYSVGTTIVCVALTAIGHLVGARLLTSG